MSTHQSRFVSALGHQLHYYEWGSKATSPGNKTVVMIHGLTRTGADFIPLANHLHTALGGLHCVSFDVIGRGLSTWARSQADADAQYAVPYYIGLFKEAFAALGLSEDYYIGTSMGGIIGFVGMGGGALAPYFSKVVLNDIGPYVPMEALRNIGRYTSTMPRYDTAGEVLADIRRRMTPSFGPFTDEQFLAFSVPYVRRLEGGAFTFHYDERILDGIRKLLASPSDAAKAGEAVVGAATPSSSSSAPAEADAPALSAEEALAAEEVKMRAAAEPLFGLFGSIKVPILLVRGANSELLLPVDAARMVAMEREGASTSLHTVPNCGHAPMLTGDADMAAIADFLSKKP